MSQWNIPPSKEMLSDQPLGLLEAQGLMLATYTEEQDIWNKDIIELERLMLIKEKNIRLLSNVKDKWWQVVLKWLRIRKTDRQIELLKLQNELDELYAKYPQRISEMPDVDRFELGMFVGKLFKGK